MSFSTYSQCQIPYCYTGRRVNAGATQGELPVGQERVPWGITVSRNPFARCNARHLRIMHSIPFIFAGAVCNNALTHCAALSCRTLRRVARMCSSMVSDTANMRIHGVQSASRREEKSSAVPLLGAVAGLWYAPDYLTRERQEFQEEGKPQVVLPLCPRGGRRESPRSAERNSPSEVQRTRRPLGVNTLTRFVHPAGSVQRKKAAARKGAAPTCPRVPQIVSAEKIKGRTMKVRPFPYSASCR